MPLILERNRVLEIYAEAAENKWVLPAFNAENLTSCEAILSATQDFGEQNGVDTPPIIIGITNNYDPRPQSRYYTHTRQWDLGMKLFLNDLKVLTAPGSPYSHINVMIHLDHIQWDTDIELLKWNMDQFSSIMFDASAISIEENTEKTKRFVELNRDKIIIEGACDEISGEASGLSSPDKVEKYFHETGVDIIVVNLGTEHRATASTLRYRDELARSIKQRIGTKLCLHGTSSVSTNKLKELYQDGVCKVNIWTTLERDTTPSLFQNMLENASSVVGPDLAQQWISSGLLGGEADVNSPMSLSFYTTKYRQDLIFEVMKKIVREYLNLWYSKSET